MDVPSRSVGTTAIITGGRCPSTNIFSFSLCRRKDQIAPAEDRLFFASDIVYTIRPPPPSSSKSPLTTAAFLLGGDRVGGDSGEGGT